MVFILNYLEYRKDYYYCYGSTFTSFYFLAGYKYGSWRLTSLLDLSDRWLSQTSNLWYLMMPSILRNLLYFELWTLSLLHTTWKIQFHAANDVPLSCNQWRAPSRLGGPNFGEWLIASLLQIYVTRSSEVRSQSFKDSLLSTFEYCTYSFYTLTLYQVYAFHVHLL